MTGEMLQTSRFRPVPGLTFRFVVHWLRLGRQQRRGHGAVFECRGLAIGMDLAGISFRSVTSSLLNERALFHARSL